MKMAKLLPLKVQLISFKVSLTRLLGPEEVFSSVMYFPSVSTSLMAMGPVDVLWYVVLADTSPRIIFMLICES